MTLRVAIDIGGTFTDLLAFDGSSQRVQQAKTLTTPADPVQGVLDCISKADVHPRRMDELIHGSTIAINTLIERKGAKVGLLVTRGTRDATFTESAAATAPRPTIYSSTGRARWCLGT